MTVPDDGVLVAALLERRDERAFGLLYDRHTPYLYRLALRLTGGDQAAAEELVHDAWVRSVERLASFAGRSALATWLAGFVVNAFREGLREILRTETLDPSLAADDPHLAMAAERIDLERAIGRLPPGYRVVVVLHDLEGWTHEAIGERLGIEPGTSKSQLSRARAQLRATLD